MAALTLVTSLFLTSALAAPLQSRQTQDFQITALSASLPTSGTYGSGPRDSSLQITLSYPDPSSENATLSTTTCSVAWTKDEGPGATDWATCEDSSVQWRLPASGWISQTNFLVDVFETLADGSYLEGSHQLDFNPAVTTDDAAYLSCIQMGKFNPLTCSLGGTLAAHQPPVDLSATSVDERPE